MKQNLVVYWGLGLLLTLMVDAASARTSADRALGQWREYAINSIKPDFDWADKQDEQKLKPSLLANAMNRSGLTAASRLDFSNSNVVNGFDLGVGRQWVGDRPGARERALKLPEFSDAQELQLDLLAPSFQTAFAGNQVRASVVLAEQQFAFWKLGSESLSLNQRNESSLVPVVAEQSNGVGFRVDAMRPVHERVALRANAQSRIDMDSFMAYRGVFAEAGDFDVPASLGFGVDLAVSPEHTVSAGVERVYFSKIQPFTSSALPDEFLGLLGDGGSPVFAWQDLDILSLAWTWNLNPRQTFELRYSTSQQPEATSAILNYALADQFSDTNFALQYTQRVSEHGSVGFSAAYSGAQSYLGYIGNAEREYLGHQLEANLVWTQQF